MAGGERIPSRLPVPIPGNVEPGEFRTGGFETRRNRTIVHRLRREPSLRRSFLWLLVDAAPSAIAPGQIPPGPCRQCAGDKVEAGGSKRMTTQQTG